jgi:hypothetical protein
MSAQLPSLKKGLTMPRRVLLLALLLVLTGCTAKGGVTTTSTDTATGRVVAATQQPVSAVVVLSAAMTYGDVSLTASTVSTLTMPKLIVAAKNDSLTDPEGLLHLVPPPHDEQLYLGFDHGANLLIVHADLPGIIQAYLENHGAPV